MAHVMEDRIHETSTTTGTGAFTLDGALAGFKTFASKCSVNDTMPYIIEAVNSAGTPTGEWETGVGTYSGVNTLTRTTVLRSSNADAAVNFSAGTKRVRIGWTAPGGIIIGDPGTEATGINIGGTTYQSTFKVTDINGSNLAQTILHRHSTTLEPLIVGARANSDTSGHTALTAGQNAFSIHAAGYVGSNYKLFGSVSIGADTTGTLSNTSAPGRWVFNVTPDASVTPAAWLTVTNDKVATFAGRAAFTATEGIRIQSAAPFFTFYNTTPARVGYFQHNGTDLVLNNDIGAINIYAANDGTKNLSITSAGHFQMGGANTVIDNSRHIYLRVYTVAGLPAAGTAGRTAFVSDANATTFASIVAGGGANGVPVYDDGTNWRIG